MRQKRRKETFVSNFHTPLFNVYKLFTFFVVKARGKKKNVLFSRCISSIFLNVPRRKVCRTAKLKWNGLKVKFWSKGQTNAENTKALWSVGRKERKQHVKSLKCPEDVSVQTFFKLYANIYHRYQNYILLKLYCENKKGKIKRTFT